MGAVDELLPRCMLDSIQIFLVMTGILVMVVIVNPWMMLPVFALGIFFALVRIVYLSSAQDIKRLEGISTYRRPRTESFQQLKLFQQELQFSRTYQLRYQD